MNVEEKALEQLIQELVKMLQGIRELEQFEVQPKRSLRKNDGKYAQLFDESAMGLTGMLGDITEQKLAAVLVDRAAAKYRRIFDNSVEGIFQCTWDGWFIVANPACARILGYASPEELIVQDSAGDRPYFVDPERYKELQRLLQEKGLVKGYEAEVYRKDGSKIWISANTWAMRDASGAAVFYEGTMEDITEEKFAKEKLRESEERYRILVEHAIEGIGISKGNKIVFANRALLDILGYKDLQELTQTPLIEIIAAESTPIIQERFEKQAKGESVPPRYEAKVVRRDGQIRDLEISTSEVLIENERCSLSTFREITDRKRAEEALRRSEEEEKRLAQENAIMAEIGRIISSTLNIEEVYERFAKEVRKLIQFDRIVINIINPEDNTFIIPYALGPNVAEREVGKVVPLAGTGAQWVMQNRSSMLILEENWKGVIGRCPGLFPLFRSGLRSMMLIPLISKDQVIAVLNLQTIKQNAYTEADLTLAEKVGTQIAGAIANAQLFQERKRVEKRLRESEEKYRSILESIEDGYFEVDLAGNFTFLNESLCKILGQSRDELMGMNNRQYMDKESARKVFETFHQVYTTGKAATAMDWILLRKDGTRRFVETSTSLMRNRNGTPTGFQGIARDITDRKRTEEALHKAKLSEEASKAKGKFLANMSHEIRTPLNAIIGMTELAMDAALDDSLRNTFHTITRETDALLGIINEILDFSKIEAGKLELEEIPFDLSVTMENVADNIAFQAGQKGLGFRSYRSPDLPSRFMGDPGRLRQILLNLSGNALKFTDRGEICIKAEMAENLGERVKIRFSVTDTGIGIPEDKQTAIFESFAQADGSTTRKYGGTGLGLAISKRLAELMGGEIGVESEEGKGSTFWFTAVFARLTDEATLATFTDLQGEELAAAEEGLLWHGRILLAEDYQTNQRVFTEQLNRVGCKVVLAENGKEAVEIFAAGDFDLVFMDVHMPEMDGLTATRLIRKQEEGREKRTPIIALTASVLAGDQQACHDAGMNDFLEKPLKRRKLLVMLKKWLGPGEINPLYRRRPEEGTESELPDSLPGLDIRKTMAALACDPAMYRKIAATFFQENLDTVNAMQYAFAVRDWATLERLAHSLKSTSGAIGARTLQERAFELEKRSREADAVPPAPELIDQIDTACRQVMGSLTSLVQSDRREQAPRRVKQLDPEALAPILQQFARVITIADTGSIQTMLSTMKQYCDDEAVTRLENQLDSYDYEDALETLREIAGRIGVTISLNP